MLRVDLGGRARIRTRIYRSRIQRTDRLTNVAHRHSELRIFCIGLWNICIGYVPRMRVVLSRLLDENADLMMLTELHYCRDSASRVASGSGRVLYPTHGAVRRTWCSTWSPGLQVVLSGTVRREWPLDAVLGHASSEMAPDGQKEYIHYWE
jgi:hypothetical protein